MEIEEKFPFIAVYCFSRVEQHLEGSKNTAAVFSKWMLTKTLFQKQYPQH